MSLRPLLLILFAVGAFAGAARAQAPAPAAAPAPAPAAAPVAADASVARPNCQKPGEVPGALASDLQRRGWQQNYTAWGDCMKKFINDQRALAEPYNKASNAAIEEYNNTVKGYNELIEKLKEASK